MIRGGLSFGGDKTLRRVELCSIIRKGGAVDGQHGEGKIDEG